MDPGIGNSNAGGVLPTCYYECGGCSGTYRWKIYVQVRMKGDTSYGEYGSDGLERGGKEDRDTEDRC